MSPAAVTIAANAAGSAEPRLKITEIFRSLQGEADSVGWPTTFVRLTGCPLRCQYCDTAYAFHGGEWWTIEAIVAKVREAGMQYVCVTGGEPLAQTRCHALLATLCDAGFRVSLETSGAMRWREVDARVVRVIDIKTPDSGESQRNRYEDLVALQPADQLKFVICSRTDYEWSRDCIARHGLTQHGGLLFSPSHDQIEPRELADWMLADKLNVRFQLQLHKLLWGNEPGR